MPCAIFDLTLDEKVETIREIFIWTIYMVVVLSVLNFLIIIFAGRMLRVLKNLG